MTNINCGQGYVYNPDSGKCIKATGSTAKKLAKRYGPLSQSGDCDGLAMVSSRGVPFCSRAGTIMQRKSRLVTSGGLLTGSSQVRVDDRIAEALREVKRTLVRKNARIRELKKDRSVRVRELERDLAACEKRVDTLISQVSSSKKSTK